jgi:hypothetical protein
METEIGAKCLAIVLDCLVNSAQYLHSKRQFRLQYKENLKLKYQVIILQ